MDANSKDFRAISEPKNLGFSTDRGVAQRKPTASQGNWGSLTTGLRNHLIAAIAGLVFGYFVLCCLGPEYEFLNLFEAQKAKPQVVVSERSQSVKKANVPSQASTSPKTSVPIARPLQQARSQGNATKASPSSKKSTPADLARRIQDAPASNPRIPSVPEIPLKTDIDAIDGPQTTRLERPPESPSIVEATVPMPADDFTSKEARLQLARQNATTLSDFRRVAEESLALGAEALKSQNRDGAIRLSLLAESAANSAKDDALIKRASASASKYVATSKTFTVSANRNWQAAVDVRKGDVIVTNASGTWHTWPDGGEKWKSDADGTPFNAGKTFPLPGAKQGALLGRIGSKPFVVGRSAIIDVENNGRLEMINNDDVRRSDNRGVITVEMRVLR